MHRRSQLGAVAGKPLSEARGRSGEGPLRDAGFGERRVEGLPHADWMLVDAGDVIVHIFRPEVREFHNLEKTWAVDFVDGREVTAHIALAVRRRL